MSRSRTTSRLAVPGVEDAGELAPSIPTVRGRPVGTQTESVVAWWPNLAGMLEPVRPQDTVVWNPSLAPRPPRGTIVATGHDGESIGVDDVAAFRKDLRRLDQLPGVATALAPESLRAIVLTPGDSGELPPGCTRVPAHLAEFPGGIIVEGSEAVLSLEQWLLASLDDQP